MELFEMLKDPEKAKEILGVIENCLRSMRKWGRRGVNKELADATGFSPAYVGQIFSGKRPLTENFVLAVASYMGVTVEWLAYGTPMEKDKMPPWMDPIRADIKREYSEQAHQALDQLLSKIDVDYQIMAPLLVALKNLPLEYIVDIRWQLLKLLREGASVNLTEEEIDERNLQMRKLLKCESQSYLKIEIIEVRSTSE